MSALFQTTRRVEFGDTDMAGIMHFANFFRFMEVAETEFLRALGLSVAWQTDQVRLGFPRVSASCDYFKPAFFEDLLTISVAITKIGTKSITYRQEFSRGADLLARGRISAVCCRAEAGHRLQSIEIPSDIRAKLSPYLVADE